MSTQKHTGGLGAAVVQSIRRSAPAKDATADAILNFRRELKSAEVEGIGTIYYMDPPSVAEREAYQKHMRFDDGGFSVSMLGMVDGVIARVRTAGGRPLFNQADRPRLLDMPAGILISMWHAIGGDNAQSLSVEAAEKK